MLKQSGKFWNIVFIVIIQIQIKNVLVKLLALFDYKEIEDICNEYVKIWVK